MPDTLDQLEKLLAQQRAEKLRSEEAVAETRTLLERADERRKNATTDRARWDRTLDNLENTLAEQKRMVTVCESRITQTTRKIENGDYRKDAGIEDDTPSISVNVLPESISPRDAQEAVDRILKMHIIHIQSVPGSDYRLAKVFLDSSAVSTLSGEKLRELRRRISILDKSAGPTHPKERPVEEPKIEEVAAASPSPEIQKLLKGGLEKASSKNYIDMSIGELEALARYTQKVADGTTGRERATHRLLTNALREIKKRIDEIPFD